MTFEIFACHYFALGKLNSVVTRGLCTSAKGSVTGGVVLYMSTQYKTTSASKTHINQSLPWNHFWYCCDTFYFLIIDRLSYSRAKRAGEGFQECGWSNLRDHLNSLSMFTQLGDVSLHCFIFSCLFFYMHYI